MNDDADERDGGERERRSRTAYGRRGEAKPQAAGRSKLPESADQAAAVRAAAAKAPGRAVAVPPLVERQRRDGVMFGDLSSFPPSERLNNIYTPVCVYPISSVPEGGIGRVGGWVGCGCGCGCGNNPYRDVGHNRN